MERLPLYALLDGLIHYAAFLICCGVLFLFIRDGKAKKNLTAFLRAVVIIGGLGVCRIGCLKWDVALVPSFLILLLVSFLLIFLIVKPLLPVGCAAALISVFLLLFMEQTAIRLSQVLMPDGPTFAVYMGLQADESTTGMAVLPHIEEPVRVLYFQDAYTDRRTWMADLSPLEREQNCEETASFLYGQGYANNDYSIAAIQTVDIVNLIELVSFFNLLKETPDTEFSLPDATEEILNHLVGIALTDADLEMLNVFAGLCNRREIDRAMAIAGEEVQQLQGQSEFAGTVLLAMAQAGSGYPIDLLLSEQRNSGALDEQKIFSLASNHWKKQGLMLAPLSTSTSPPASTNGVEEVEEPASPRETIAVHPHPVEAAKIHKTELEPELEPEPEPEPQPEPDPFIKISTHLGIVYVPDEEELMHEWIAAANALQIRGYVALGNELVILKMDGTILRKHQEWLHDMKGYTYRFKLESVQRNRVSMRATGREKSNL